MFWRYRTDGKAAVQVEFIQRCLAASVVNRSLFVCSFSDSMMPKGWTAHLIESFSFALRFRGRSFAARRHRRAKTKHPSGLEVFCVSFLKQSFRIRRARSWRNTNEVNLIRVFNFVTRRGKIAAESWSLRLKSFFFQFEVNKNIKKNYFQR